MLNEQVGPESIHFVAFGVDHKVSVLDQTTLDSIFGYQVLEAENRNFCCHASFWTSAKNQFNLLRCCFFKAFFPCSLSRRDEQHRKYRRNDANRLSESVSCCKEAVHFLIERVTGSHAS